jgi:hypothetical protein
VTIYLKGLLRLRFYNEYETSMVTRNVDNLNQIMRSHLKRQYISYLLPREPGNFKMRKWSEQIFEPVQARGRQIKMGPRY